jgi:tripeptide aminopeptidase
MAPGSPFTVVERFMRYVQIDTQSDPHSEAHPSSEKQKKLSQLLAQELLVMGIADAHTDQYGYVYATIGATTAKKVPVICLCSHVDTAPDCSGTGVKPILHANYSGQDIVLPDDHSQVIRMSDYHHGKRVDLIGCR